MPGRRKRREIATREEEQTAAVTEQTIEEQLHALVSDDKITVEDAASISTVMGCVDFISSNVASLPINIYRRDEQSIEPVVGDYRNRLLNAETGDLLDAYQWKKRMAADYLLYGSAYTYVDKVGNAIRSLRYINPKSMSAIPNTDPIFKTVDFYVQGTYVRDYEVLRILRNTNNGYKGIGIVDQANRPLSIIMDGLLYERSLFRSGARKGFLKSAKRLSESALKQLTRAVKRLFSNSDDNVVVLNSGVEYQPAGQTAVETQLNEMKKTNAEEICKMFCVAPSVLAGGASEEDRRNSIINAVIPVVDALESALNRFCLLEAEKGDLFIKIDRDKLLDVSQLERFQTYEIGKRNGWMMVDEIRQRENLPPIDFDYINIGLDSVLYDPKTKQVYTPNTNQSVQLDQKGGDTPDGTGDQGRADSSDGLRQCCGPRQPSDTVAAR